MSIWLDMMHMSEELEKCQTQQQVRATLQRQRTQMRKKYPDGEYDYHLEAEELYHDMLNLLTLCERQG